MDRLAQMVNGTGQDAPAPFAVLDFLFPGFSVVSSFLKTYTVVDLNLYIPVLLAVLGSFYSWNYISSHIWHTAEAYLMSSVTIRTDDEMYSMVMAWIAKQSFARSSRQFIVNTSLGSRSRRYRSYYDSDDSEDGEENQDVSKKPLHYTPSYGSHYFWYRGRLIKFSRSESKDGGQTRFFSVDKEELHIQCLGRNPGILKELLIEARAEYNKKDANKTLIYRGGISQYGDADWSRAMSRAGRPFSTVILNQQVKQDLVDDVSDYLDPDTRRWYSNRGIPYRRGYLFHGPPGTGKSSLSLALAGYFNMRIYMVSLNSPVATEENLSSLFQELPRRCCVLLEDIDSAGLSRTAADGAGNNGTLPAGNTNPDQNDANGQQQQGQTQSSPRLSLSGLLNILDGVASQEGRILIMTTNHIEKLDKALIRPGRVDMMVHFGRADSDMCRSLYKAIYTPYENEIVPGSKLRSKDTVDPEKLALLRAREREDLNSRVNGLSDRFAAVVPELEFSPAEIQGLLLRHKRDPEGVIDKVPAWVEQTKVDRLEKARKEEEKRLEELKKEKKKELKEKRRKAKKKAKKQKKKEAAKKKDKTGSSTHESDLASGSESDSDSKSGSSSNGSDSETSSDEEVKTNEKTKDEAEEAVNGEEAK